MLLGLLDVEDLDIADASMMPSAIKSPPKNFGKCVPLPPPAFILATVTLTTIEVDGVAVLVTNFTEVGGVYVTKKVDVLVGGV